jgi:hypothetical protein
MLNPTLVLALTVYVVLEVLVVDDLDVYAAVHASNPLMLK